MIFSQDIIYNAWAKPGWTFWSYRRDIWVELLVVAPLCLYVGLSLVILSHVYNFKSGWLEHRLWHQTTIWNGISHWGGGRIMLLRGGVFCMKWGEFVSFRCTFVGNRELNVIKTCKIRNQVDRSLQILKISYYDKITKSMLHIHSITSLEERFCYRHFFRLFGGILLL